jgi:hypothetical protein
VRRRTAEELLLAAPRRVGLLAHLTPDNFEAEVARLTQAPGLGAPQFEYRALPPSDELDELARELDRAAERFRIDADDVLRERALELSVELRIVRARGSRHLRELARQRYEEGVDTAAADDLARAWLAESPPLAVQLEDRSVLSDDESDPSSLVNRLRSSLGALRAGQGARRAAHARGAAARRVLGRRTGA